MEEPTNQAYQDAKSDQEELGGEEEAAGEEELDLEF